MHSPFTLRPRRRPQRHPRKRTLGLFVEHLEDRCTPSTLVPITGHRDLVYDAARNTLYITTINGQIQRYDLTSQTLLTPWAVGTSLFGADITPDNNFLYVTENQVSGGQGTIHKVNLGTGGVTNINYPLTSLEVGGYDLAIMSNGKALFTGQFAGSGWVPIHELQTSTDTFAPSRQEVRQNTQLGRAFDRNLAFFTESNSSGGPIKTYNALSDSFPNSGSAHTFLDGALPAVSPNSSRLAMELQGTIAIMNPTFGAIDNLPGADGGLAFDPIRNLLYAVNSTADQIVAYDTNTWVEKFRMNVEENVGPSGAFGPGTMIVSNDGTRLFLATPAGVRIYNLPTNPGVVAALQIDGFPRFIGQGTTGGFTVRAVDSFGNVVTNYNGTVRFTSTDSTATLPATYTFQSSDAGVRNFTATLNTVGTPLHSITVTEVMPASRSATQSGIQVHNNSVSVIPFAGGGVHDHVYDAGRGTLYITTGTGLVERYHLASQTLLAPWDVGNNLWGADITVDGNFLYVMEGQRNATQGLVRKVNLSTGAVTNIPYNLGFGEGGGWDLKITSNGRAFFDGQYEGSGWTDLRQILLSSDTISVRNSVRHRSGLSRGADRRVMFFAESDISSGPIGTYRADTDTFPGVFNTNQFLGASLHDVNRNATLAAVELGSGISVRNAANLATEVRALTNLDGGLAFDPNQDLLYAARLSTLFVYDTNTWNQVNTIGIGESLPGSTQFGPGVMTVTSDSSKLFVTASSGVRIVPLTTLPTVTVTASDASASETGPDPGVFTVSRSGSTAAALTVSYTLGGSATNGSDYNTLPTTVTIPIGQASANITLTPIDDPTVEGSETAILTLSPSSSYTVGSPSSATVTIADNDASAVARIIDNVDPGYSEPAGPWFDWTGGYNNNFRWSDPVAGNRARWTTSGLGAGNFTVQATWVGDPSHSPSVAYRIYDGGSTTPLATVLVNQSVEPSGSVFGGRPFQLLATVTIASGTLRVEMDSNTGGYTIADAVRVASLAAPTSDLNWTGGGITGPTSATTASTFTISRTYNISGQAVADNFTIGYYRSNDAIFGNADDVLLGTENITAPADKTVGLHPGTSPALQITVAGTYFLFARVDDGNAITETNEGNNVAQAPSQVTVTEAPSVILDNGQPGYSEVGTWADWNLGYNDNFRWSDPVAGNRAIWTIGGLGTGNFTAQATWVSDASHAQNVVYRLYDGSSTTPLATVLIDQRLEPSGPVFGGRPFQALATVTLTSGTLRVEMDSNASGYTIADAIRVVGS